MLKRNLIKTLFFLLIFLPKIVSGQEKKTLPPYENDSVFDQLIYQKSLCQVKDGKLMSGLRNDTLFVIFFDRILNKIFEEPLCDFSSNQNEIISEFRNFTIINSAPIKIDENVFIFKQSVGIHGYKQESEHEIRFIVYDKQNGIINIFGAQKLQVNFPYYEGDFFIRQ